MFLWYPEEQVEIQAKFNYRGLTQSPLFISFYNM